MKIGTILEDIIVNKSKWLQARKGSEFEDRFEQQCKKNGFTRYLATDLKQEYKVEFTKIKKLIQDDYNTKPIDNILNKYPECCNMFLTQPFGSQDYPDFLLFTDRYIVPIEIKYSTGSSTHPIWNGNLPKANGVYIFGNYDKQDIALFKGDDILPNKERKQLIEFWDKVKLEYKQNKIKIQQQLKDDSVAFQYGFDVYIRKTFQQNKQLNQNAITNLFEEPYKSDLETKLLQYIKGIDE